MAWLTLPHFSTSHKRHDFRVKKKLLDTKCVVWLSLQHLSETFLILRRNKRDVIKKKKSCRVIYLLTAIGLTPGGSSTVHIYIQTIHITQNKLYTEQHKIWEECGPCPVFTSYTLAFALQLRKKHGKTSVIHNQICYWIPTTEMTHLISLSSSSSSWALKGWA